MEDRLIELLQSFGYPVRRQGSLADDEKYPDTFFTFWNTSDTEHSAYDNDTQLVDYDFMVNVYSTSPNRVYDLLSRARTLLKSEGWIIAVRGYDAASDESTHTGRGCEVQYINTEH